MPCEGVVDHLLPCQHHQQADLRNESKKRVCSLPKRNQRLLSTKRTRPPRLANTSTGPGDKQLQIPTSSKCQRRSQARKDKPEKITIMLLSNRLPFLNKGQTVETPLNQLGVLNRHCQKQGYVRCESGHSRVRSTGFLSTSPHSTRDWHEVDSMLDCNAQCDISGALTAATFAESAQLV